MSSDLLRIQTNVPSMFGATHVSLLSDSATGDAICAALAPVWEAEDMDRPHAFVLTLPRTLHDPWAFLSKAGALCGAHTFMPYAVHGQDQLSFYIWIEARGVRDQVPTLLNGRIGVTVFIRNREGTELSAIIDGPRSASQFKPVTETCKPGESLGDTALRAIAEEFSHAAAHILTHAPMRGIGFWLMDQVNERRMCDVTLALVFVAEDELMMGKLHAAVRADDRTDRHEVERARFVPPHEIKRRAFQAFVQAACKPLEQLPIIVEKEVGGKRLARM
mmetsp:Transcript_21335/g.68829  ORF Transcript_21335/g.68829 Transcript_21335/m.68829 type:complete len:276 (+) Transcript_21335:52-879(+)